MSPQAKKLLTKHAARTVKVKLGTYGAESVKEEFWIRTAMICGTFLCVWKRGRGTVLLIMALDEVCLVGTVPWLEELPLEMTTSRRNSFLELFDLLNFQFV